MEMVQKRIFFKFGCTNQDTKIKNKNAQLFQFRQYLYGLLCCSFPNTFEQMGPYRLQDDRRVRIKLILY